MNINPALKYERERATFEPRSLTYFLDGGEKVTKRKEKARKYIEDDPIFRNGESSLN